MFRASSCPSSGATTTALTASGLPSELGDSSAVGRGRAVNMFRASSCPSSGATTTALAASGLLLECG
jgi:hypothetical protein